MAVIQERFSVSSSSSSPASSLSLSTVPIDGELWIIAEERAQEILCAIQPFFVSDRSRNEIFNHVKTLMKDRLGVEVFLFGSVPLKTYLPDGDIDLTVLTPQDKEEDLAKALCSMLEARGREFNFPVTGVQYIPAKVKVIKFNISNIAVDISFNQVAGLCALCFLEQVDQKFGRDHLFKRSIILVKAWCYYESRILGANTGLISTYALAVLVLYIINISYSSVSGPLAVLFKFLDYYGSFDWENYCITVTGPVPISSHPETGNHEVFLNEKFFKECVESYLDPIKVAEANRHGFPVKKFNILDPLKRSNNLGLSVTEGNAKRLRRAFSKGAQRLRNVLTVPEETIGWRLEEFFSSSLERNGKGQRQDVKEPVVAFGTGTSEFSDLRGDYDRSFKSLVYGKWFHGETQHNWIPQGQDTNSWDIGRWYMTGQRNVSYSRNLHGSTAMQNMRKSRGTGTYIPEMSQQSYTERFSSKPITVKSLPSASQTQPASSKPSTVKSLPSASQTQPFSSKPSTVKSLPSASQTQPFSSKPITVKSLPSASQTQPFSSKPSTVKSLPSASQTQPFSSKPSTVKSLPSASQTQPFSSKPSTVKSLSSASQTQPFKQNP